MTLTVTREVQQEVAGVMGTLGSLAIDGDQFCSTLERTDKQIPAGRYRVALTTSERARKGGLWTPRKDFLLPLVQGVQGRDGIRFHAANRPGELDGCIAVGVKTEALPGILMNSRMTLTAFMERLGKVGTIWLDIA